LAALLFACALMGFRVDAYRLSMLIKTTAVARLFARPRLWAHKYTRLGRFGRIFNRYRKDFEVELSAVEAEAGVEFTPSQLTAAGLSNEEPNGPKT
jgi:hypothetical protein